jgi:hypothetical protein
VGSTTATQVISAGPARLCRIVVTGAGTSNLSFYDSSVDTSGTLLFTVPSTANVGQVYDVQMPAMLGITAGLVNKSVGVCVSYNPF